MKERKPRTKEQPWYYKGKCPYFDGPGICEKMVKWRVECNGNIHLCNKMKFQWLASLSDKKRDLYIDNERF